MKTVNQTIAAATAIWILTAGSAFAEIKKLDDPLADINFNIGVEEKATPDHIDIELVSRICENVLDKRICLDEGLQQAVER